MADANLEGSVQTLTKPLQKMSYDVSLTEQTMRIQQGKVRAFMLNGGALFMAVPADVDKENGVVQLTFPMSILFGSVAIGFVLIVAGLIVRWSDSANELGIVLVALGTLTVLMSSVSYFSNVLTVHRDVKEAVREARSA